MKKDTLHSVRRDPSVLIVTASGKSVEFHPTPSTRQVAITIRGATDASVLVDATTFVRATNETKELICASWR